MVDKNSRVRAGIAALVGLYGAHRCFNEELQAFCHQLFTGKHQPIKVVLLLEEDIPPSNDMKSLKQKRGALASAIHKQLNFLSIHCYVHNCNDLPKHFQWSVK